LLQGTWQATSGEMAGVPVPAEVVKTAQLVVTGDKATLRSAGKDEPATLKLDPSATPKTVDILALAGPDKGKTQPGIYEVSGDTLKLCIAHTGNPRPTTFSTKAGEKTALMVFQRVKR